MSIDVPADQSEDQNNQASPQLPLLDSALELQVTAPEVSSQLEQPQQQQQKQVEPAVASSSSIGSSSAETDPEFGAERMLSRIRTMAPDVNRRPADSGRVPASGSMVAAGGGGNAADGRFWGSSGVSFMRVASRVRIWGSGFFQRQQQEHEQAPQQQQQVEAADSSPFECGEGESGRSSSGVWARLKLRLHHSMAGLFTPPAYLPGGVYYNPPAKSTYELQAVPATGFRAPSAKGLLALGPVRSVLPQPSLRFNSGKWTNPAEAASGNAAAAEKGTNGAAAGPVVGQLVAAEGREIGSVSWLVYGQYFKQIGLLTTGLLTVALFVGQGLALAAEWWLALWAASPTYQQRQVRWVGSQCRWA